MTDLETKLLKLVDYARHLRTCNSFVGRFACGATNGRRGKCPNRAVWAFRGFAVSRPEIGTPRDVIHHRCNDHLMRGYEKTPLPPPHPCSCGLATLIAGITAEVGIV